MDKLDFEISDDAADYLRTHLLRSPPGESLVLTIAPLSTQSRSSNMKRGETRLSNRRISALRKDYLGSLSTPVTFHWVVGGTRKERVEAEAIVRINGVECFLPKDLLPVIRGRVLGLKNGELVFDPELDPPPSHELSKPAAAKRPSRRGPAAKK